MNNIQLVRQFCRAFGEDEKYTKRPVKFTISSSSEAYATSGTFDFGDAMARRAFGRLCNDLLMSGESWLIQTTSH